MCVTQTARNYSSAHSFECFFTHFLRDLFQVLSPTIYSALAACLSFQFYLIKSRKQTNKEKNNIKKALPLLCPHSDAALNQMKLKSCKHGWNVNLWNMLGCVPQPILRPPCHLFLEAAIIQCEQINCQLFTFSSLWIRRQTLNGTTSVRWHAHKSPALSLTKTLWLTVVCLIILAEHRKQGNAILGSILRCCHHIWTKTLLFWHSFPDWSVKC